jgi:hypothetical protein
VTARSFGEPPTEHIEGAATAPERGSGRDIACLLVTALPALAIMLLAAAQWGDDWTPSHDLALIDLRLRDVGSSDTPLLGAYSRFGWNHPGPLMFWLLAPIMQLLGGGASAGLAAAGLQNAGFVVLFGWLAHRVGGRRFHLVSGVALAVLCASLGSEALLSTWNPWLLVLPFAALIVATWGMANGDLVLVPVVVGVASFVAQTHLGLMPIVAGLVAVGAVLAIDHARSAGPTTSNVEPGRRRLLAASLAVLTVVWIGPVAHELWGGPSNVGAVAGHLLDADEPAVGWSTAWGITTRQLAPIGPWAGGSEPVDFLGAVEAGSTILAAPFVVLFGWAGWRVRRRGDQLRSLWILVATGLVVGVVATSRITGLAFTYLVRWWWVLAMVGWVVIVLVAGREISRLVGRAPRGVGGGEYATVAVVVAVAMAAGVLVATSSHPSENQAADEIVATLAADAIPQLVGGTYAVRYAGSTWPPYFYGFANELDRAGVRLVVSDEDTPAFGHARTAAAGSESGSRAIDGVVIVATGLAIDDLASRPDRELLAEYEPLAADDRSELIALQSAAIEALEAMGRDDPTAIVERSSVGALGWLYEELDPAVVERLAELLAPGDRVAVFLVVS